jgi:hypothetical protein
MPFLSSPVAPKVQNFEVRLKRRPLGRRDVPQRRFRSEDAKEDQMPEQATVERAKRDRKAGKAASTQAGEFVHEEIRHVRRGKHGARSTKQAIAIGLSKARRAGVPLKPPKRGKKTRVSAAQAYKAGQSRRSRRPSATRSRAISGALKREGRSGAARRALARQARLSARRRTAGQRSAAAQRAVRTKGAAARSAAARKAARTRARRG